MFRAMLFAALLLVWTKPVMSIQIVDPWPDPEAVQGIREEAITFQSSDPFVPRDIGRAPTRMVRGILFLPKTTAPNHATPAVVMLHGSAGMVYDRAKYGPQLASMGMAVLLIESYDSRRDLATGFIERVLNITETMFVADAYAALAYLAARLEIDPRRVFAGREGSPRP
jgi:hypothetical protein